MNTWSETQASVATPAPTRRSRVPASGGTVKSAPAVDVAWLHRGAALDRSACVALELDDDAHAAPPEEAETHSLADFCEREISRIAARLAMVRQVILEASALSAVYSRRGHTQLALQYDVRARMLMLEEGLLVRALDRWETIRNNGQIGGSH